MNSSLYKKGKTIRPLHWEGVAEMDGISKQLTYNENDRGKGRIEEVSKEEVILEGGSEDQARKNVVGKGKEDLGNKALDFKNVKTIGEGTRKISRIEDENDLVTMSMFYSLCDIMNKMREKINSITNPPNGGETNKNIVEGGGVPPNAGFTPNIPEGVSTRILDLNDTPIIRTEVKKMMKKR